MSSTKAQSLKNQNMVSFDFQMSTNLFKQFEKWTALISKDALLN